MKELISRQVVLAEVKAWFDERDMGGSHLLAVLEQIPVEGNWISVEERLPEECLYVIVYLQGKSHNDNKDIWHIDADYFEDGDWHRYPENGYYKPTHWMPLPQPPEEPA